jgi:hypothetical protein
LRGVLRGEGSRVRDARDEQQAHRNES